MKSCVSVSLGIGIRHCVGAASLPPPPQPHLGHAAGGAGSRGAARARNGHTTALFATKCQSFLDNVIASLAQVGAWNDLPATPTPLTIPSPRMAEWRELATSTPRGSTRETTRGGHV